MTADSNRTFTSRKLDWLDTLAFDRRLSPLAFKVGFRIIQHVNASTGRTRISDATIADEIGCPARNVYRPRILLRDTGWLTWRRTRTANIYEIKFDNVERLLDLMTAARDVRKEQWQRRQNRLRDHALVRNLNQPDCAPTRTQDCAPMRNKHLREDTLKTLDCRKGKTLSVKRVNHADNHFGGRAFPVNVILGS
jgi:hypothetical protein